MRHRVHGRKLGRTTAHRTAMLRNQLTSLFIHERITTTLAKAKELRPLAERTVTLARTGTLANRRRVLEMVSDKEVVARLFDSIAPRFADRPGGYTRILRVGRRRGDNAELAIIEFIDYEPAKHEEGGGKPSLMDRAKGMFGARKGGAAGTESAEPEADEAADQELEPEEEPAKPKRSRKAKASEADAAGPDEPAAEEKAEPKRARKKRAAEGEPEAEGEGE